MSLPDSTYPIREFARLSGVNPVTLRAWERRYGIIQPQRTHKGHRYYTDQHLSRVRQILYWLEQGYPVRQVRMLLNDDEADTSPSADHWPQQQQQLLLAARHLTRARLEELLHDGFASYPVALYHERCLQPVLQQLRSGAEQALICHAFEDMLQRYLDQLQALQQRPLRGPLLLLAMSHEQAGLETRIIACALGAAGIRLEFLPSLQQPADLQLATDVLGATQVWLHLHPLSQRQEELWRAHLQRCSRPHYLSGSVPAALAGQPNGILLPPALNEQIGQILQFSLTSGASL